MRLINTSTLVLEEFTGTEVPAYAILSHTWEPNQEVSLQEWHPFLRRLPLSRPRKKKGYAKILAACREARKQKLDYLWCDTNCINKSSSSELTEAINSMFSWYRGSSVCFVYLADVSCPLDKGLEPGGDFERSRWFTRGWTLQELLAPNEVLFYSANWELLGDKYDLRERISAITLIDEYYVQFSAVSSANTARKMSWVSRRVTTRLEDLAYCMLGILGVNMPLLYGEGSRAFVRLQEEIIRQTNDHTIFCWSLDRDSQGHYIDMSIPTILAPHPIAFSESNTIWETAKESWPASLYSIANAGLHIQLPLLPLLRRS
ncbi:heterokaryon incompatibility protein-domain-containing protein [Xylariaceae sp. FL0662B]|nr:heterokaryon incompatibility protein-domain-containing protein [Xylariaceae sp. FL0662B]